MILKHLLSEAKVSDLIRAYFSDKNYIFVDASIFNVGAVVSLICTDKYKDINYGSWNGYDSINENDEGLKTLIAEALKHIILTNVSKIDNRNQLKRIKSIFNAEGIINNL